VLVVLNLFDIRAGAESQYAEYLRRVQPILDRYGAKVLIYGLTRMVYMGPCTQEYCGVIAYPDMRRLKELSRDPEFLAIRPLRDESTRDYVMTAVEDFETMNHAAEYLDSIAAERAQRGEATGGDDGRETPCDPTP
jgi:uncharacterized protein (DUF1330 family)